MFLDPKIVYSSCTHDWSIVKAMRVCMHCCTVYFVGEEMGEKKGVDRLN